MVAAVGVGAGIVAALVVLWPGDGGPSEDPGVFMTGLLRQIASNEYDRAWTTLHPSHQRIVNRADYVRCEARSPIPGRLDSVNVLKVSDERVRLAGTPERVAGKAIRVRLTFSGLARPLVVMHTGHAVAFGDRWTWILPPARFADYRAGRCPGS